MQAPPRASFGAFANPIEVNATESQGLLWRSLIRQRIRLHPGTRYLDERRAFSTGGVQLQVYGIACCPGQRQSQITFEFGRYRRGVLHVRLAEEPLPIESAILGGNAGDVRNHISAGLDLNP